MSSSNCCFLTCIRISQEAGQMVCYPHLFQNFPQFTVIHTVKGFGLVNKAEIDVFLELSCFFHDPVDVGNLISGSSAFSKTSLNIWNSVGPFKLSRIISPFQDAWFNHTCQVFFGMSITRGHHFLFCLPEPTIWPQRFRSSPHAKCIHCIVTSLKVTAHYSINSKFNVLSKL